MKHLSLALMCALVATSAFAEAEPPRYDKQIIRSFTSGFRCALPVLGREDAPDTLAGEINLIGQQDGFRWPGPDVPAVIGFSFGVQVQASEKFAEIPVTVHISRPAPDNGPRINESWTTTLSSADTATNSFSFEYPEELNPGKWVMEARSGARVLYHVEFDVYAAENPAAWRGLCPVDLLS